MSDKIIIHGMIDSKSEKWTLLIPTDQLESDIIIEEKTYLLLEKQRLEHLLNMLQEYKGDINELRYCVVAVLRVLGLLDEKTQSIKESIKTGQESYFKYLLGALKDVLMLLTQAKFGFKDAEKELLQKFDFVKKIIPLIEKYNGGK